MKYLFALAATKCIKTFFLFFRLIKMQLKLDQVETNFKINDKL